MKRLLYSVILSSLFVPSLAFADTTKDVWANTVFARSNFGILSPEKATGEPDGLNADFNDIDAYFTVDMGADEPGSGDLIVTIKLFELGAAGKVILYDADWKVLATVSPLSFSAGQTKWIVSYSGETPYQYVRIENVEAKTWGVDAIQATQVNTPNIVEPVVPVVVEETIPYCILMNCGRAGELIKVPESQTVYFIGLDGKRHAFPNGATLTSWSYSFDQLFGLIVDNTTLDQLAEFPLGKNMTIRPGTYMVKIVHDPKVYAVEPGGILRWITTEDVASELYGTDWNKQIVDVDETFWKNYTIGAPVVNSFEPPIGYYFIDHENHYIVTKDGARLLTAGEVTALRLDDQFAGNYDVAALNATEGVANNSDLSVFVEAY